LGALGRPALGSLGTSGAEGRLGAFSARRGEAEARTRMPENQKRHTRRHASDVSLLRLWLCGDLVALVAAWLQRFIEKVFGVDPHEELV
jgi:hypothetical protein